MTGRDKDSRLKESICLEIRDTRASSLTADLKILAGHLRPVQRPLHQIQEIRDCFQRIVDFMSNGMCHTPGRCKSFAVQQRFFSKLLLCSFSNYKDAAR